MPLLPSSGVRRPSWPGWERWYGGAVQWVDREVFGRLGGLPWPLSVGAGWLQSAFDTVAGFLDTAFGFVFGVAHWVFDAIADGIYDLARAADQAYYDAIGVAQSLVDGIAGAAGDVFGWVGSRLDDLWTRTTRFVGQLIDDVKAAAYGLFLHAVGFAQDAVDALRGWATDAITFVGAAAHRLVDDLRAWAGDAIGFVAGKARDLFDQAVATAHRLVDAAVAAGRDAVENLRGWAGEAIDVLRRDVLDKVSGPFTSFIDTEWRWAMNLLKLLEHSAEWLLWVGEHAVPEAVATYRAIRDLGDASIDDLARWGAALGAGR